MSEDARLLTASPPTDTPEPRPLPLLLGRKEAAALCGIPISTWDHMTAAAMIPRSIRLGRRTVWRREELLDWIDAGCPDRRDWEIIRPKWTHGRRLRRSPKPR